MKTLKECIEIAINNKKAIGHFNISNIEGLWAVFNAARVLSTDKSLGWQETEGKIPVIIGVSEGERDFIGTRQVSSLVKSIRDEYDYPIFINADHTYSFERVKEAIDAGFDSVIYDGAELSLEENISNTKKCVDYARGYGQKNGKEILVEGELGYIGKSSKILDDIPEGAVFGEDMMTTSDMAKDYCQKTGIDLLAPAVGNIHGMLKGGKDPALNIERIKDINQKTGKPLVLHGGSGNSKEDFILAIKNGCAIVHINTELRVAYRKALILSLSENPEEIAPYKYLKVASKAMQKVVEEKIKIFNGI